MNPVQKTYYKKFSSMSYYIGVTFILILAPLLLSIFVLPTEEMQRYVIIFGSMAVLNTVYIIKKLRSNPIEIQRNDLYYQMGKERFQLNSNYKFPIQLVEEDIDVLVLYFGVDKKTDDREFLGISLNQYQNHTELINWVKENLKLTNTLIEGADTALNEIKEEIDSIQEESNSSESKKALYISWKRRTTYYFYISFFIFFWIYAFPLPKYYAPLSCLLFAWYCIFVPIFSKGIVKLSVHKSGTKIPLIGNSLLLLSAALVIYGIDKINLVSYWSTLSVAAVFFAGYTALLLYVSGEQRTKTHAILSALGLALLLSYGTALVFNTSFYEKEDSFRKAKIISKHSYSGKDGNTYFLNLDVKPAIVEDSSYEVGKKTYNKYNEGDTATFVILNGHLGIPFYKIK